MTRRAGALLVVALIFYVLANQTQVGWLYLMSNGLLALVGVGALGTWRALRPLRATRVLGASDRSPDSDGEPPAWHEDDPLTVTLTLHNPATRPIVGVRGEERCPVAPLGAQAQPLWLPYLLRGTDATFQYTTTCDRRGPFGFPPLRLHSAGPFGLFRTRHTLPAPAEGLVYPRFHPFRRLRGLEHQLAPERQAIRAGAGSEVLGTRDYRPGDAPRTVHWRSSARVGRLVVKEFAQEAQSALVVALDLARAGTVGEGKLATFEVAVRIAASLAHFATERGVPFHLVGSSPRWRPPRGALGWWAVLNLLARAENDGEEPFERVLARQAGTPLLIALVSRPDAATQRALAALERRGTQVLAVLITPDGALPEGLLSSNGRAVVVGVTGWEEAIERAWGRVG